METMDIKDQIRITEELLEGVKELNGEYQEGWENNILEAENLIKHLKQVKNNDLLHSVIVSHLRALTKMIEDSHCYGFDDVLDEYLKENSL